jgi:hypothetical protein
LADGEGNKGKERYLLDVTKKKIIIKKRRGTRTEETTRE